MVSIVERWCCYTGLFALYTYTSYKFINTRNVYDTKFHQSLITQGKRFVKDKENFRFVETSNEKLIFLVGIDNNEESISKLNFELIDRIFDDFSPNYLILEKDTEQ